MGCCLSTGHEHGTTSPASMEEEAVKEVLLETPFIFKQLNAAGETLISKKKFQGSRECMVDAAPPPPLFHADSPKLFPGGISPEVSEISELYSYSIDGFSKSNMVGPERRVELDEVDDGEANQRTPLRQRQALSGGSRRVPARAATSPEKRSQVTPSRQVRNGQLPRVGSVRRPRSPMTRREVGDRRGMSVDGEIAAGEIVDVELDDDVETLENPIVSLECFIFL